MNRGAVEFEVGVVETEGDNGLDGGSIYVWGRKLGLS